MMWVILGIIVSAAIVCELIDSWLGMMYGTILSPVLIIAGYDPKIVVPSILFSQAMGGFIASYQHHKYKNASFKLKSKDFKIATLIVILGIIAVVLGAFVGAKIPKVWLQTYIGVLCVVMGVIVLLHRRFKFSWRKIMGIGFISSFNKALSGGGFGPVVASGQIISGRNGKNAIGTTDFAEAPICIMSFLAWVLMERKIPDLDLLLPLTIGALIGGFLGPVILSKNKSKRKLAIMIGILAAGLGIWTLFKTWT